jgi:PAS domain S-box-containing protein
MRSRFPRGNPPGAPETRAEGSASHAELVLLHASESRFRKIFEDGPLGMVIVGPDYRYMRVNSAFCRMVGYTEEELCSRGFPELTHPDDVAASLDTARRVFGGEEPHASIEKRYVRKNGTVLWARVFGSVLRDEADGPSYGLALVEDITERKRAEAALGESEARFRQVFEDGSVGMAIFSTSFRFLEVNRAFCQMLGYAPAELVGRNFQDVAHADDIEPTRKLAQGMYRGEMPYFHMEKRYLKKNGDVLWVSAFGSAVRDAAGEPLYAVAMIQDITERKRAEAQVQALEAERRQMEQAQRLRVVQAQDNERAMLSRELHDGVGQILTGLQLSLVAKDRDQGDLAQEIAYARLAASTIGELSRLLHPPELEIGRVFKVVCQYLCSGRGSGPPTVTAEIDGEEPALAREQKVHLFRITQEAVANAQKHAHARRVRVDFRWRAAGLRLEVADDGRGMPETVSIGVGLRSMRDRAAILGGEVSWTCPSEGGTRVVLEVPLAVVAER